MRTDHLCFLPVRVFYIDVCCPIVAYRLSALSATFTDILVMDAESWKKYVQAVEKYAEEHKQASQSETPSASVRVNNTNPPPLATHADVTRPIAVVCPESEVDTPLVSSVTRKSLFDGDDLDASIL